MPTMSIRSAGRIGSTASRALCLAVSLGAVLLQCSPAEVASPPTPAPAEQPKPAPGLLVIVVVDQFRADYLERYDGLWKGGIRWLLDRGAVVEGARLLHARSATAPGHATLATGVHPSRHGIIDNQWTDRTTARTTESVDDQEHGKSPRRMRAQSIADVIDIATPASRIYGIAGKDRGAILTAGHRADGAYWYNDDTGDMVSSRYYREQKPAWLAELNRDDHPRHRFGAPWSNALLPEPTELAALGIETLRFGPLLRPGVGGTLGGASLAPGESYYGAIFDSPVLDELTAKAARRVLAAEGLGQRDALDVLTLSFSATDRIGHRWGMDSPEVLDTLLRLDLLLGDLFAELEERVGRERLIVAFSSDHGVLPVPEVRAARGEALQRISTASILCIQGVDEALDQRWGERDWFRADASFDEAELEAAGVTRPQVEAASLEHLRGCPGVVEAYAKSDLLANPAPVRAEDFRALYSHMAVADLGGDLMVQFAEGLLPTTSTAANHGSPYWYDRAVPMIFVAPGVAPGPRRGLDAATIDFAPTLAALVGVGFPGAEGRPLALHE
jgi:predicted AlkP superfamily pyrophosphatase or phosphodiesterase